jgi:hypothetical protein
MIGEEFMYRTILSAAAAGAVIFTMPAKADQGTQPFSNLEMSAILMDMH